MQLLKPLDDVVQHFLGNGFLDVTVLGGEACGAVLEEVIQPRILLEEVFL